MFNSPLKYCLIVLATLWGASTVLAQGNTQKTEEERKKNEVNPATNINQNLQENNIAVPALAEPSRSAQSSGYYRSQTETMRKAVDFNQYDAKSWLGYYKAVRYSYYTKTSNDISEDQQSELNAIVNEMGKYVPNSYEFNYAKYLNGNHDIRLFGFLARAYELNSKATEIYDQFVAYYELTGNANKKTEWCKKLNESGEIPREVMELNYNMLVSLDDNAVLITHGEMDSYPAYIWQNIKKVRPDVTILYIDLLEKAEYRERKFKELGIQVQKDPVKQKAGFVAELSQQSAQKRPTFLAGTVAPELLKPIQSNLYLTGLAFRYSPNGFDNLPELAENWERKFKKEELSKKITPGTLAAKMNMNYVPGLILLAEHLRNTGKTEKAQIAEDLALKIATEGGKEQQVKNLLKKK